jgi:hypothetical protein
MEYDKTKYKSWLFVQSESISPNNYVLAALDTVFELAPPIECTRHHERRKYEDIVQFMQCVLRQSRHDSNEANNIISVYHITMEWYKLYEKIDAMEGWITNLEKKVNLLSS